VTARALVVLVLALPAPVVAQVRDSVAARDSARRLLPVTVTAAPIAGAAGTAPYALSVRTTAQLPAGTAALALDDAFRAIPGVQIDNRFNFALGERISVRGAGARAQFGVRGVRVLVDGIPATLPDGQTVLGHVDLAAVARIEALRGPVASLYGNASGGAILIETTTPPTVPIEATASATAGASGLRRARATVGGVLGPVALGAALSGLSYQGHRTHASATSRWATARVRHVGTRSLLQLGVDAVDYDALNPGSLSDSLLRVDRARAFTGNVTDRTGERGRQWQVGARWQRQAGGDAGHAGVRTPDGGIEAAAWLIGRDLENPIPRTVITLDRTAGGVRAVHRGGVSRLAWTAGAEAAMQRDDRQNYGNQGGARGALTLDQLERVLNLGLFAQSRLDMDHRVGLVGGVRFDRTTFRAEDRLITATNPDDSGERTLAAVSPSAGVTVALPGAGIVYANVGTAFETPTTTELANRPSGAGGFNPELQPQRTVAYEIGARHARGRVRGEIAAYRSFVRDALLPFAVSSAPGRQYFRNIGRTGVGGVEIGASADVLDRLRVDAAYSYTRARFRQDAAGDTVLAGNAIPGVAPHRAEITATWRARGGWAAVDGRHVGRLAVNDANTAWSPAYTTLDARAGIDALRVGRVAASVFGGVQNLGGVAYNASVVVNAFGRRYYEPGPGRTAHLGASVVLR